MNQRIDWVNALVGLCFALVGCGDDGASSDAGAGGGGGAGSTAASTAASTQNAGSTSTGTSGCSLDPMVGDYLVTGSFTFDQIVDVGGDAPTGKLDALVGKRICFGLGLDLDLDAPMETPNVLRLYSVTGATFVSDDASGLMAEVMAASKLGFVKLAPEGQAPLGLTVSVGAPLPTGDGGYSFQLGCRLPEPFELDAMGLPVLQPMQCDTEAVVYVLREGSNGLTTDGWSGPTEFSLTP